MSTTDRAFINAFARQRPDGSAPLEQAAAKPAEDDPIVGATISELPRDNDLADQVPLVRDLVSVEPAQCDLATQRGPEDEVPEDERSEHERENVDPAGDEPARVYARHDAARTPPAPHFESVEATVGNVSRPLSHFSHGNSVDEAFRPAASVEGFAWPDTCCRLVGQMADDWDGAVSRLLDHGRDGTGQVVGIAGCRRGAGCTTVLLCLARRLAELGVSVAMVDADLGQPTLAQRLGVVVKTGWGDVLRDGLPLCDAMVQSTTDRAALLPARRPMPVAEQGVRSLPASIGLRVLRSHYRLVLVDMGPLLDVPREQLALGLVERAGIDTVLLVHDMRQPHAVDRLQATSRLRQAGTTVIGITETFATC
ncbi:MAG: hypothetical protein ACC645_25000 [Pirellulales bacterium]